MKSTITLVLLVLMFILCFAISLISDTMLPTLTHFAKQRHEDDMLIFFNVLMFGTLIWPLLFINIFPSIDTCPWILVGLMWPIGLGILQMYDMYYDRCEEIKDHQERRSTLIGGIHFDSSTIISFAFACATFFWAIGNLGNKEKLIPAARVILVVLLICVGFIVPTQNIVDNSQRYSLYIRAMQRIAVNYTIGLLITALIIVISNCVYYDPQLTQTSSKQTKVFPPR